LDPLIFATLKMKGKVNPKEMLGAIGGKESDGHEARLAASAQSQVHCQIHPMPSCFLAV
jgi:hypothetical protein